VKEKPPDACSSGGKMQEAPTPCVSVSEFDYRASGKSRNQKSQPRLLRTFQNSLNLGQSARNKDSKQPQNTTQTCLGQTAVEGSNHFRIQRGALSRSRKCYSWIHCLQGSLNAAIITLAWTRVSLIILIIIATVVVSEWVSAKVRHAIT